VECLDQELLNIAFSLYGNRWRLIQDGAGPHRSNVVKRYIEENEINKINFPSNSPNLNCIEKIWFMLKHEVDKYRPRTGKDPVYALQEGWDSIDIESVRHLLIVYQISCET